MTPFCRGCGLKGVHATADECIAALTLAVQQAKERSPIWWKQELELQHAARAKALRQLNTQRQTGQRSARRLVRRHHRQQQKAQGLYQESGCTNPATGFRCQSCAHHRKALEQARQAECRLHRPEMTRQARQRAKRAAKKSRGECQESGCHNQTTKYRCRACAMERAARQRKRSQRVA